MKTILLILSLFVMVVYNTRGQDSLLFSGQVSSWVNLNPGNNLPLTGGLRYIPQLNYFTGVQTDKLFSMEFSANIYGSGRLHPFDTLTGSGRIKPYRAWVRYSTEQFELRLGLQKLNFGSAMMLRPLMWFDQLDPRDPLQLTDGVWGVLARYYFLNNANVWLWSLYGNEGIRGWERIPVNSKIPEFGGRIQLPVPGGEMGFTYHHRVADSRNIDSSVSTFEHIPENKFGFDVKWDLTAGLWLEGSYTNKLKDVGILTNQTALDAGVDYTFGIGNGLYVAYEQLLASYDDKPFAFKNNISFSLLTLNYPVGIVDNVSVIIYYDWSGHKVYNFINWKRQFDKTILYFMAYWNPETFLLPAQTTSQNIFTGKGIQLMFVFNH